MSSGFVKPSITTGSPRTDSEHRRNRDAAPRPDRDGRHAKGRLEGARRGLGDRMVHVGPKGARRAEVLDLDPHAPRGDRKDVVPELLEHLLAVLVRDEAAADLRVGVRGDDRLEPSPAEPPRMPLTSSVGRTPKCTRGSQKPRSPATSSGTPATFWNSDSSNGRHYVELLLARRCEPTSS